MLCHRLLLENNAETLIRFNAGNISQNKIKTGCTLNHPQHFTLLID